MTKIRLFEAFAGVGSQYMALKNIGVEVEPVGISEWDINALLSYDLIHSENTDEDLTTEMTLEEVEADLRDRCISTDGKEPITEVKLSRLNEKKKRRILSAMIRTNNIGSIIGKTAPECDLFTYSFPCQDISVAGRQGGFSEGSDTRSSLLWQCRNTIEAVKPKVLLMENVKNLVGIKHKADFDVWCQWLEEQGYTNYWQVLNAKDFGVPQNRERVFMVSILEDEEDQAFEFPTGYPLEKRIKDILIDDEDVEERYYVKDEYLPRFRPKEDGLSAKYIENPKESDRTDCINVLGNVSKPGGIGQRGVVYDPDYISGTIMATDYKGAKLVAVLIDKENKNTPYKIQEDYRVRQLTPHEYWRLMGFRDEDFLICQKEMSNLQLYRQAGNSIVVPVLEGIFKQLYLSEE